MTGTPLDTNGRGGGQNCFYLPPFHVASALGQSQTVCVSGTFSPIPSSSEGRMQILLAMTLLTMTVSSLDLPEIQTTCETMPSTIHVTKEEYDETGRVVRTCEGTIGVNKCEGTCVSQVQPSVITPTGFLKDCQCCRESWMRQRDVKLTECYDPDGQKLDGADGVMIIHLQEPEECQCHTCGP